MSAPDRHQPTRLGRFAGNVLLVCMMVLIIAATVKALTLMFT